MGPPTNALKYTLSYLSPLRALLFFFKRSIFSTQVPLENLSLSPPLILPPGAYMTPRLTFPDFLVLPRAEAFASSCKVVIPFDRCALWPPSPARVFLLFSPVLVFFPPSFFQLPNSVFKPFYHLLPLSPCQLITLAFPSNHLEFLLPGLPGLTPEGLAFLNFLTRFAVQSFYKPTPFLASFV